jgi:hypothetical protein
LLSVPSEDEWDDFLVPAGGPPRYYHPLKERGLWLQFAETCQSADSVLQFAAKYGGLTAAKYGGIGENLPLPQREILNEFLRTGFLLKEIAARLGRRDRKSAAEIFQKDSAGTAGMVIPSLGSFFGPVAVVPPLPAAPLMRVIVCPSERKPGKFEWRFVPHSLRDALLFQAAEAIAGNRRFQRCRNEGCPNWFQLGPHTAAEGNRTITARRQFCTDRCRVASARREKRARVVNA